LKLIDFGSSCNDEDSCENSNKGTYVYLDPFFKFYEVTKNLDVSQNNDLFAFGVCVYFIIMNKFPNTYKDEPTIFRYNDKRGYSVRKSSSFNGVYNFKNDDNYETIHDYLNLVPNIEDFNLDYLLSNKYY
jgi:serine/threonine protein kinase